MGTFRADNIVTSDGGIAGLDPALLQKVSDGTWETAVVGTQYFSPDQHAGIYGIVIREYFGALTDGQVVQASVGKLISQGGECDSGTERFPIPTNDGTNRCLVEIEESTNDLEARVSGYTVIRGWVDYALITDPSTSPSSKVMPTIDPTVLQRVDDMTWETVTLSSGSSDEYFSPDQRGGVYGKIIRKYFEGTGETTQDVQLEASFASTKDLVEGGGVLIDSGGSARSLMQYTTAGTSGSIFVDTSGHLQLRRGSTFDESGDSWKCYVEYTLVTPPTTRPTGQPFADPYSGLLKRVDTGAWEIPPTLDGTGSITAFADATGGKVTVTSASHGQTEGISVKITGTTNYNGGFTISNVTTDTFDIVDTWVSNDATGSWEAAGSPEYYSPHAYLGPNARCAKFDFTPDEDGYYLFPTQPVDTATDILVIQMTVTENGNRFNVTGMDGYYRYFLVDSGVLKYYLSGSLEPPLKGWIHYV